MENEPEVSLIASQTLLDIVIVFQLSCSQRAEVSFSLPIVDVRDDKTAVYLLAGLL